MKKAGGYMDSQVLVAILALIGTLIGSFTGILVANKLVNYRLELLEKKVGQFNNFNGRLTIVETECTRRQTECKGKFTGVKRDLNEHVMTCHPGEPIPP
jgi:hypothetical protein